MALVPQTGLRLAIANTASLTTIKRLVFAARSPVKNVAARAHGRTNARPGRRSLSPRAPRLS